MNRAHDVDARRDAETFEILHRIRDGISDNTWGVAHSRDGSRLALGTEDGRVAVYDTEFFEKLCDIRMPLTQPDAKRNYIFTLMWTPDDTRLVTCTGRYIRILESERPLVPDHRVARWNEKLDAARAALGNGASSADLSEFDPAALRIAQIEQWATTETE